MLNNKVNAVKVGKLSGPNIISNLNGHICHINIESIIEDDIINIELKMNFIQLNLLLDFMIKYKAMTPISTVIELR